MSTITASPISGLTDEQRDFQTAIRDFADRECGTAEQRERLLAIANKCPMHRTLQSDTRIDSRLDVGAVTAAA